MKKVLLLVMGLTLFLLGCEKTYDYSDFSDRHIEDVEDQLSMPEDEYYIYFYGSTCEHCLRIKQEALGIIANLKTDVVYFVVANSLEDVQDGVGVTQTPSLVKVVGSVVIQIYSTGDEVLDQLNNLK